MTATLLVVIVLVWLVCGVGGVILTLWIASDDERPYRDSYSLVYDRNAQVDAGTISAHTLLGPIELLGATLKWAARSIERAKKEKRLLAEQMEKDLAEARREVDALFKRDKKAAP